MVGILDMNRITEMRKKYPSGWMLIDKGTSRRIPFAFWANLDTGEWKAYKATEDGLDQLVDHNGKEITITGKAQYGLAVIAFDGKLMGTRKPRKKIDKQAGIEMFHRLVIWVQGRRGDSRKCGENYFRQLMAAEDISDDPFLDDLIIKRAYPCQT